MKNFNENYALNLNINQLYIIKIRKLINFKEKYHYIQMKKKEELNIFFKFLNFFNLFLFKLI